MGGAYSPVHGALSALEKAIGLLVRFGEMIRREVLITYQLTRSNGVLAAFPGLVLGPVAAFVSRRAISASLLRDLALAATWPLLYLYTFEACNQLTGVSGTLPSRVSSWPRWRLGSGIPLTAPVWAWIANLCSGCAVLVTHQDLKDVEGDVIKGRRTVPVVLGEGRARRALAAAYAAAPFFYYATMLRGIPGAARFVLAVPLFTVLWCIAYRTLAAGSRRADAVTFQLFSWWCLYMMALPLFIWPCGL
ncbi:hypothetical protein KFL_001170130 [Klebsormidium nitens]|uniref:Uncharacterized protein n=1 Tax=Klebsormidium nitens TaxID=105231 RepID=A0A1Y1HZJ5_KLENI|nr:hypothetical protein KFL_001170130 [Klebsormidium nitens]|eukprot:GAQ82609.1 hypothetical protein KFL_001170130 [Klebsormidium nitens]